MITPKGENGFNAMNLLPLTMILTLRSSNDEWKNEYNDISQRFIVFEALEVELQYSYLQRIKSAKKVA